MSLDDVLERTLLIRFFLIKPELIFAFSVFTRHFERGKDFKQEVLGIPSKMDSFIWFFVYFEWILIKHTVFLLLVFSQDTWNKAKTMATLQTRDLVYDQPKAHLCSIPLHGWPIPRHRVWSQRNCRWGPQVGQGQNWPQRFRTR